MHYFLIVAVNDCRKDLTNNLGGQFLCENTIVDNLIEKLSTFAIFCD
jgi:hypothetical protein